MFNDLTLPKYGKYKATFIWTIGRNQVGRRVENILELGPIPIDVVLVQPLFYERWKRGTKVMGMEAPLDDLEDEWIGFSAIGDPPPDFLEWNGRMFRKSMEANNEYI